MKLIKSLGRRKNEKNFWVSFGLFWCDFCKQEVERPLSYIKCKSCGCNRNKKNKNSYKHGETKTRLHIIWTNIKQRCFNPKHKSYKDYGGRGITICPEWTDSYITFRDWSLNNGYKEGLQINRIDNNGNYEPNNCNFVTIKENSWNRRSTKLSLEIVEEIRELYKTGDYTQDKISKIYNISRSRISIIINNKNWRVL